MPANGPVLVVSILSLDGGLSEWMTCFFALYQCFIRGVEIRNYLLITLHPNKKSNKAYIIHISVKSSK